MRQYLLFTVVIVGQVAQPLSAEYQVSLGDVRPVVEEMLNYHVEYKQFNAPLLKRSFKIFVDQFDPYKIYFTAEEVTPYLATSEKKAQQAALAYQIDRFPDFMALSRLIGQVVERNAEWRGELQRGQAV